MPYLSHECIETLMYNLVEPCENLTVQEVNAYELRKLSDTTYSTTGLYIKPANKDEHYIYLLKSLPNYQKAAILLHEYGHFSCTSSGCECAFGEDEVLPEVHAILYQLEALMDWEIFASLSYCVKTICLYYLWVEDKQIADYHIDVANKICETDLWHSAACLVHEDIAKWSNEPRFDEYILPMVDFALVL